MFPPSHKAHAVKQAFYTPRLATNTKLVDQGFVLPAAYA
jgi:hypothetical protein